jgi:uncharacterized protein involved in exopolysaccharide biosynthesis
MEATSTLPLRRQWWVVLTGVVVGLVSGGALIALSPTTYSSSASILVEPVPMPGQPGQLAPINLGTEAELARSSRAAQTAAEALGRSPDHLADAVSVDVVANTSVLLLHFEASTPEGAQAGAQAFAQAYLTNRADVATSSLSQQLTALTKRIDESTAQLAALDARIAKPSETSPEWDTLRANRATLTGQITR